MEDALVPACAVVPLPDGGLNPCFNGRCTRTRRIEKETAAQESVLILVLMEDALVHFFDDDNETSE